MEITIKEILITSILLALALLFSPVASAQSSWEQCTNGDAIARCETYDCPQGDTNNDGSCTLEDSSSRLSDARSGSFCANPLSGCGEIRYFSAGNNNACSVRVEQKTQNCNLYAYGEVQSTPTPSPSPTPTPAPTGSVSELTCRSLIATPKNGQAPLTVSLNVRSTGTTSDVDGYEFEITDPSGSKNQSATQKNATLERTFSKIGTYTINANIITKNGEKITSAACNQEVKVVAGNEIGGGGDKETKGGDTLPETGSSIWVGVLLAAMGAGGVYLYEKYRFV